MTFHRWPALVAMTATVAGIMFPFQYLPTEGSGGYAGVKYAPSIFLAIASMVLVVTKGGRQALLRGISGNPVVGLLIVYWCVVFLGLAGTESPVPGSARAVYYISGCLPLLLLLATPVRRQHIEMLCSWVAGAGVVLGLFCCIEYVLAWNPFSNAFFTPTNPAYWDLTQHDAFPGRVLGPVGHPVVLGSILAMTLPPSLWRVRLSTGVVRKALWGLGSASILAGVFLSYSRGAWLAVCVCLITLGTTRGGSRLAKQGAIAAVVIVTLAALSSQRVRQAIRSRNPVTEYVENFSKQGRVRAYSQVAEVVSERPLYGIGLGEYRFAAKRFKGSLDTPDNMYLVWLAESGSLGLIAGVGVLLALLAGLWPLRHVDLLAAALHASILGFSFNLLIADLLHLPSTRLLFWCIAGLGMLVARYRNTETTGIQ